MRLGKRKVGFPLSRPRQPSSPYTGEWRDGFPWEPEMKHYEVVDSERLLRGLGRDMRGIKEFAFDTETNTLEVRGGNPDFKCVCVTISWGEGNNYYIPLGHDRDEDVDRNIPLSTFLDVMKPVFEGAYQDDLMLIGQNLKFDMHVLKRIGIDFRVRRWFCTMLASWLCDENTPNGLKENAQELMGLSAEHFKEVVTTVPSSIKKEFGLKANSKATYNMVLIEDGAPYALADSFNTYMEYLGFRDRLKEEGMDGIYQSMYVPFLKILYDMEERGVTVDEDRLRKMRDSMDGKLERLTYDIYDLAGVEFNIGSSQQKAEILFGWEKPHKPFIQQDAAKNPKLNSVLNNVKESFRAKEITFGEAKDEIGRLGLYMDDDGKIWRPSNRNTKLLENSFDFRPYGYTAGGAPVTDSDAIWRLSRQKFKSKRKMQGVEMCRLLLEYSKVSKLKTAFADGILGKIDAGGKVHPRFNQIGTDSGRLSCSDPNLQQLPNAGDDDEYKIRDVFVGGTYYKALHSGNLYETYEDYRRLEPKELQQYGYTSKRKKVLTFDYHNLEMVCLCYFSRDKHLTEMFSNDDDAHGSTAVNMFGLDCTPVEAKKKYPHLRQAAKTINFMLMYGGGAGKLYESLASDHNSPLDLGDKEYLEEYHCRTGVEVAQKFIDRYFETYSGVAKFISGQKRYAHRKGCVYTILGRKRRLPDINSQDMKMSSYCERLSVNSAIQGTAADITINAQIRVSREPRLKELLCDMIVQIHDEIVFEVPEENLEEVIPIIKHCMEHPFGDSEDRSVPFLRADSGYGDTYQEAK